MPHLKFEIKGMHCKSCKVLVEDILEDLGVKVNSLQVDEKKQIGTLLVETSVDPNKIITAIKKEGAYTVTKK